MTPARFALLALLLMGSACGDKPSDEDLKFADSVEPQTPIPAASDEPTPSDATPAEAAPAPGDGIVDGGDAAEEVAGAAEGEPADEADGAAAAQAEGATPTESAKPAESKEAVDSTASAALTAAPRKRRTACDGVDSALSALILSEDRAATARAKGLTMVKDRVRVIAELVTPDADLEGPVEEELRAGTNAQVLIQPDSICDFAATRDVKRVRRPEAPSPK